MSDFSRLSEILSLLKAECDRISPELRVEMLNEAIAIVEAEKSSNLVTMPDSVRVSKAERIEAEAPAIATRLIECHKKLKDNPVNSEFERFWEAVEKRLDKKSAKREFERIKGVDTDLLIAKIKEHQEWHKQKNGSLKFLPYPFRWLRLRRWEDELTF